MGTLDHQYSMWAAQKQERVRLEDNLSALRTVEHFAYFKRKGRATAAAAALSALGFHVTTARAGFKTTLRADRPEPLVDQDVQRFLAEVVTVIESHSGEYDGWGATTAD